VVEVDGMQHREGLAVSVDNLSRNAVVLTGDRVLRIDLVGLRLHEDAFMQQVALGLATSRWR
jgi:very-short-patch-repair endonuclease